MRGLAIRRALLARTTHPQGWSQLELLHDPGSSGLSQEVAITLELTFTGGRTAMFREESRSCFIDGQGRVWDVLFLVPKDDAHPEYIPEPDAHFLRQIILHCQETAVSLDRLPSGAFVQQGLPPQGEVLGGS